MKIYELENHCAWEYSESVGLYATLESAQRAVCYLVNSQCEWRRLESSDGTVWWSTGHPCLFSIFEREVLPCVCGATMPAHCRCLELWRDTIIGIGIAVLAVVLLVAFGGCRPLESCPPGWREARVNCREYDCSYTITPDPIGSPGVSVYIPDTCTRCDDVCESPDGKVRSR